MEDLEEIWEYTAGRWDVDQADRYITTLYSVADRVSADPATTTPIDFVRSGYSKVLVESHVIYLRESPDAVRVLHQRQDVNARVLNLE